MKNLNAPLVAIGVLLLALVLAVVDTGEAPRADDASAAPPWTAIVEAGHDHIEIEAFARLLLESPEQLLVVDVRPAEEFEHFHLPGAVNLDLVALLGPEGASLLDASEDKSVVLVSNGMTHPAQAWVALVAEGRTNVRILGDGLDGFVRRVLTPPSLRGATTERRARGEAAMFAALRARILSASKGSEG